MNDFIRLRNPEKLTIVVMDNASVHRKAVEEAGLEMVGAARCLGLFLPAYSPELNPIKILGKKIKYEWLPWTAFVMKRCAPC
jgi:transposase